MDASAEACVLKLCDTYECKSRISDSSEQSVTKLWKQKRKTFCHQSSYLLCHRVKGREKCS